MNNYGIPAWMELEIRNRDKQCVYCGRSFVGKVRPSVEHIINDVTIVTLENLAICCIGCNASKGQKKLSEWINSKYCKDHNISFEAVSEVIREALKNGV